MRRGLSACFMKFAIGSGYDAKSLFLQSLRISTVVMKKGNVYPQGHCVRFASSGLKALLECTGKDAATADPGKQSPYGL